MLLEDIKPFTKLSYHKTLLNKLWTSSNELRNDVRQSLIKIADEFTETLKIDNEHVVDTILTGSTCNYNYTKHSDIDLHIVVNYENICDDCDDFDIVDCMDAKKALWNDRHDITIYDVPVEVYVHDMRDKITGNAGVFSLTRNKWLRKPSFEPNIKYDPRIINDKIQKYADRIDAVIENGSHDEIDALQKRMRDIRGAGVEKDGEFSVENIVYKELRNQGKLDKLFSARTKIKDKELSLK